MSKVKRILSVIMAMVMVLAMSVPTFAAGTAPSDADKATITVTGIENGATVQAYRIVEPLYNDNGLYGYQVVSPYTIADHTISFLRLMKLQQLLLRLAVHLIV